MPTFFVYVEFYGKKLKIELEADNEFRADNLVRSKIHILKIEQKKEPPSDDEVVQSLKNLFGIS